MASVILLIEPNKLFAQNTKRALVANGHTVNVATSAQAAIASADEQMPALVVLEIELAKHNGIEFLYEFRSYADWQNIPVIIYSHLPESRFKLMPKQLKLLGVDHYFDKAKTSLKELVLAVASELEDEPTSH